MEKERLSRRKLLLLLQLSTLTLMLSAAFILRIRTSVFKEFDFYNDSIAMNGTPLIPAIRSPDNFSKPTAPGKVASAGQLLVTDIYNDSIAMDDPRVIQEIRKSLVPPSTKRYNFSKPIPPGQDASAGQLSAIIEILKSFGEDAFFLDCGAMDGETASNTLLLEKTLNWRGLMIEANPVEYAMLVSKNRKAWSANFCLSNRNYPQKLQFYQSSPGDGMSSLILLREDVQTTPPILVACFPLYSVLLAVNRTTVDFFSFDVEGSEMDILRTVPFDKVIFKVLVIENILIKEGKEGLRRFMEAKDYAFFGEIVHEFAKDSIFIHLSVSLTAKQRKLIGKIHMV